MHELIAKPETGVEAFALLRSLQAHPHDFACARLEDGAFVFQHPTVSAWCVECMCDKCQACRSTTGRLPTYWPFHISV